ncbi:MAG: peptidylprolyl isomerase [Candidatus Aminicenantes bacterium]|nr:MAG: peptidylprolyl isomerase [Candidatus Aminicenantes bacterium]
MAGKVKKGDTIKVHYSGKLEDGREFDSSLNRQPIQFEVGAGKVIKGFEDAVVGLEIGEKKTVTIPAKDAYGSYDENLLIEIPKKNVPEGITPEVGMRLQLVNQLGQSAHVVVTEILDETVRLDANHPLAGKTLVFELEILEIV